MPDANGPTVRRRRLGSELRRLRDACGLRLEDVAKELECSTSKVSRVENGQGLLKSMELRALLELYGVTDPEARDGITAIHRTAGEPGWWEQSQYEQVLPSGLGVYVGLEYDATVLQTWESGFIPGLLQTADYARAVFGSWWESTDVEPLVAVRQRRQQRLTDTKSPLELWAIIDEAALMRPPGSVEALHEQIRHLIEMTLLPNVTLQIYPLSKGVHPGLRSSFSIMEFGPQDPKIVYVDSRAGNLFLERERQIRSCVQVFNHLRASALDPSETAAYLKHAAKEI